MTLADCTRLLVVKETRINRADTEPCCTFLVRIKQVVNQIDSSFHVCFIRLFKN
jgi:hypothetical protein